MTTPRTGCIVRVGDLTAGGPQDYLTAVEQVSFSWGREDVWAVTEPSTCRLELLDRSGDWAGSVHLPDAVVLIQRGTDERVLWRGALTSATAYRSEATDPLTLQHGPAWRIVIEAQDLLGLAARQVLIGPATETTPEGAGGWPEAWVDDRGRNLMHAGASEIFSAMSPRPSNSLVMLGGGPAIPRLRPRAASSRSSTLAMLQEIYACYPGSGIVLNHETGALDQAVLPSAGPIPLIERPDGWTSLDGRAGRQYIDGRSVEYDPDAPLTLTPAASIGSITLKYTSYKQVPLNSGGSEWKHLDSIKVEPVPGATTTSGREETPDLIVLHNNNQSLDYTSTAINWFLMRAGQLAAAQNGRLGYPELRVHLDHPSAYAAGNAVGYDHGLWLTHPTSATYIIWRNVLSSVPYAPRECYIIGGEMSYTADDGWVHKINLAPAPRAEYASLQLQELFGPGTRGQLRHWVISSNDLEIATKGIP